MQTNKRTKGTRMLSLELIGCKPQTESQKRGYYIHKTLHKFWKYYVYGSRVKSQYVNDISEIKFDKESMI